MSYFQDSGVSIKPSARKSIHNHGTYCPYLVPENMLRTGSGTKERHGNSDIQEGTDEVDNILSKFAHPCSPRSARRNENLPKSYHNSPINSMTEESDEDSDELEDNPVLRSSTNYIVSTNSSSPQQNLNDSRSNKIYNKSPSTSHAARRNIELEGTCVSAPKCSYTLMSSIIIALLAIIVAVYSYGDFFTTHKEPNEVIYDESNFYNDVSGVGAKYKIQDGSILQVRTGISTIVQKEDTGSFIFPYNSDKNHFNLAHFNNFVNELASAAAKYLRNNTRVIDHVVVDTMDLKLQTAKELMNEYHADVDKTGVMLVKELDRVPSDVAMAFHYYCDEDNPLVKKSAIFFTLNMATCSNISKEKNTRENIEKCLANKWENIPRENMLPLLTRVVNVVVDVTGNF